MHFNQFAPPAAIPASVMSFDPDAGDCTCVHPVAQYLPPTEAAREMKAQLFSFCVATSVDEAAALATDFS